MKFHSPYQFINIRPAKADTKYIINEQKEKIIESEYVRHDYWAKKGLSGAIECTLKTISPLVIGAKQEPADKNGHYSAIVHPYKHPDGAIALPANSLRGMVGSLAENISQSSFRVLAKKEDCNYSVRKPATAQAPLKTVGILLKKKPNEGSKEESKEGSKEEFYLYPLTGKHYEVDAYVEPNETRFIANHSCYQNNTNAQIFSANIHQEDRKKGPGTRLFAKNFTEAKENTSDCKNGLLFIRGKHDNFPSKKRETFILWNGWTEEQLADKQNIKGINVHEQVKRLEKTLRQYHQDSTQFPKGYDKRPIKTPKGQEDKAIVLDGDLVYYKEEKGEIKELSYSQIWRRPVQGNLYDSIQRKGGKNALPWNQERDSITPVEALFGIVEDDFNEEQGARNLASRLQFTDAVSNEGVEPLSSVVLKILDSPKPPSPAMYFQREDGKAISKQQLQLNKHDLNGRKHYIPHQLPHQKNTENWKSEHQEDNNNPPKDGNGNPNWKQYLKVKPIPQKEIFTFKIHFENISKKELGLLLTSIQPTKETDFIHRIGLGKPLGLGQVKLTVKSVKMLHKSEQYSLDKLENRENEYTEYNDEIDNSYIDKDSLEALKILYNPANIKHPVCYPYSALDQQKAGAETEGFNWFVINDDLSGKQNVKQRILPIDQKKIEIPALSDFQNYLSYECLKRLNNWEQKKLKELIEEKISNVEVHKNFLIFKEGCESQINELLNNQDRVSKPYDLGKRSVTVTFSKPLGTAQ